MAEKHILLCQHCGWKKVCGPEVSGLFELKNDSMSSRKFRCPGCGRAITPRRHQDPQADLDMKANDERLKKENESFVKEAVEFSEIFVRESHGAEQ